MKQSDIQTIAGALDTLPVDSDPMYQPAVLALMIRKNLEALDTQGFNFKLAETTDLTSFNNDMTTYLANANTRFDEWLQGQVATVAANLPDVLAVGEAMLSGGGSAVGALVLNRVLGMAFHREDSRAQHEGAHTNVDSAAIVTALENIETILTTFADRHESTGGNSIADMLDTTLQAIRDEIMQVLNEFNINIYSDPENAQWSVGPLDT